MTNLQPLTEQIIEGTPLSRKPKTTSKYISQIMKNTRVTSYKELKDMTNNKVTQRNYFL